MPRQLIWDLPTRLFHWLFAFGFLAAAFIALVLGEHGPLFPYHAIIGLVLILMVFLRILWGLVGTRYARFSSFVYGPRKLLEYSLGVITAKGSRYVSHNPGSAYAIFAMLAIIVGLGVTGFMMSQGNESIEEIHELLAYAMLAVVAVHVLGVIIHSLRHRENITASMIHGHKSAEQGSGIRSSRPVVAAAFLVIIGAWAMALVGNYDSVTQTTTLPIFGTALQLGEAEGEDEGRTSPGYRGQEKDDDD